MTKQTSLKSRMRALWTGRRGQNTVEYALMLTVIIAVVLAAGVALKKFMPQLFDRVSNMIMGATNQMGG